MNAMLMVATATMTVGAKIFKDPLSVQPGFELGEGQFNMSWYEGMTLDHFNEAETRTFNLRYWVNDDHFNNETGPIFLYICGEWVCKPPSVNTNNGFQLGSELGARLVALEHRFYGESQPFTDADGGWSSSNLEFLTAK